mmetsp:Transcript_1784/g.6753  ORF Transcript_1784/g.6753 Transcript_1784/m.6753 type:complete len:204 (+) Transcript_1784:816-1427(+)
MLAVSPPVRRNPLVDASLPGVAASSPRDPLSSLSRLCSVSSSGSRCSFTDRARSKSAPRSSIAPRSGVLPTFTNFPFTRGRLSAHIFRDWYRMVLLKFLFLRFSFHRLRRSSRDGGAFTPPVPFARCSIGSGGPEKNSIPLGGPPRGIESGPPGGPPPVPPPPTPGCPNRGGGMPCVPGAAAGRGMPPGPPGPRGPPRFPIPS